MDEYIMTYAITKNYNNIKILGKDFVRNNKNKGKIVYNNKRFPLQETINISDLKINDKLQVNIKIILLKSIKNISCMFENCNSLLQFGEYYEDKEDLNLNNINNLNNNNIYINNDFIEEEKEDILSLSDDENNYQEHLFYEEMNPSTIETNKKFNNANYHDFYLDNFIDSLTLNNINYINFNRVFF